MEFNADGTAVRQGGKLLALTLAFALILGSVASPAVAADEWDLRWRDPDPPYAEMSLPRKIVSNIRVGIVGFIDSIGQAAFSLFDIWQGTVWTKAATFVGDIVAIVDHNFITQYVTQGIVSRHLLRFGAGGKGVTTRLGIIHDTEYDPLGLELKDYIEHRWFHTDAWVSPSILVTVGGIVISDLIVRPIGRIITIFGARKAGDSMDEYGKELIGRTLKVRFL